MKFLFQLNFGDTLGSLATNIGKVASDAATNIGKVASDAVTTVVDVGKDTGGRIVKFLKGLFGDEEGGEDGDGNQR